MADLNALVEEKINSDSDFQATLADMSEEDQAQAIADKRTELLNLEFTSLSEKAAKAEELSKNYKTRAEKAEQEAKKNKPAGEPETPKTSGEFSPKDYLALSQMGVSADDFDEVQDYANFKKISIAEALKSDYVIDTLKRRTEERKTAAATNTGGSRKTTSKVTGESLLEKAIIDNDWPETDEGIEALAKARVEEMGKKS